MSKTFKIASILIGVALTFSFANPEKKVTKLVTKVWKNQEVSLEKIVLHDSLVTDITSLDAVMLNNEIAGYACYTTSFGCRIGGCAVTSSSGGQAYETFDYIVIYDEHLSILKVDIANYSGEYGYEICRPKWLTQFIGKTMGFKLEENIDGISGATVSATSLVEDLNNLGLILSEVIESNN